MAELDSRPRRGDHRFIPGLESARGLAALTVCLAHACGITVGGKPLLDRGSPWFFLFNSHGAVVLFFVLSGFVLRLSLANRRAQPIANVATGFALGRLFRLYPVVIGTVLIVAAVRWYFQGSITSPINLLQNAALVDVTLNGVFWTVQVEVVGSALVLLAFVVERSTNIWGVVALTAAVLPFSFLGQSSVFAMPVFQLLYPFMFGYILAASPRVSGRLESRGNVLLIAAVALFYFAGAMGYVLKQWLLLLTTISTTTIVAVLARERYRSALQWRPLRVLGTVSYSFYALHPLGFEVGTVTARGLDTIGTPHALIVISSFVICVAVTFLLAVCLYLGVERPAMRMGNSWRRSVLGRAHTAHPPAVPGPART